MNPQRGLCCTQDSSLRPLFVYMRVDPSAEALQSPPLLHARCTRISRRSGASQLLAYAAPTHLSARPAALLVPLPLAPPFAMRACISTCVHASRPAKVVLTTSVDRRISPRSRPRQQRPLAAPPPSPSLGARPLRTAPRKHHSLRGGRDSRTRRVPAQHGAQSCPLGHRIRSRRCSRQSRCQLRS